ncbi:hypothetical protein D3C76_1302840 [compost metagenome]
MQQGHPLAFIAALEAAEQEHGRQPQRHRNDGRGVGLFVLVLMQRHFRARDIAVDQAGIGGELAKAGFQRRRLRQLQKHLGHGWPGLAGLRIVAGVAITATVGGPSPGAAAAQGDRHGETARRDHLPKRCDRQHRLQCRQ